MSIVDNPVVVVTTDPLGELASKINLAHDSACRAAATALEHARDCGMLLIQAKADIGHGGFLAWLKSNCRVKERQARNYMTVAANWATIIKSAPDAEMTVKGALQLIGGGEQSGDQTSMAELFTSLEDAGEEYKQICDGRDSGEIIRGIVAKHITEENIFTLGWDACYRNVTDELTRVLARQLELRTWLGEVADAGQKRLEELSPIGDTPATKLAANEDYGLPAELPQDVRLVGIYLDEGDDCAEIIPSAKHPGYFFVSVCRDISTHGADIVFSRRPIKMAYVGVALKGLGFSRRAGWVPQTLDGNEPWYLDKGATAAPFRGASA